MIKLCGLFDKNTNCHCVFLNSFAYLGAIVMDALANMDMDLIPCPICNVLDDVTWEYRRTKHRRVFHRTGIACSLDLPVYSYLCHNCGSQGTETFSTDITIDSEKVAYTYMYYFSLMHVMYFSQDPLAEDAYYQDLSPRTVSTFITRFRHDFPLLKQWLPENICDEEILLGNVKLSNAMILFFQTYHRFFLHTVNSSLKLLSCNNDSNEYVLLRISGNKCRNNSIIS